MTFKEFFGEFDEQALVIIFWIVFFIILTLFMFAKGPFRGTKYETPNFENNVKVYSRVVYIDEKSYPFTEYSDIAIQLNSTISNLERLNYTYIDLDANEDDLPFIFTLMENIKSDKIAYKITPYRIPYTYEQPVMVDKVVTRRKVSDYNSTVRVEMMRIVEEE